MRISNNWSDYELIDTSAGEKLERWGDIILIRPDPQVIWFNKKNNEYWLDYHAKYIRSKSGGGHWELRKKFKETWPISYGNLKFLLKPTGFKHTGLFPEQAVNWEFIKKKLNTCDRQVKLLNLFAYTGGATLAAASSGASVCHVDSSKGVVSWAKENAKLSKLDQKPIRWIIDDCYKFICREYKRNSRYDAIILDPPSYGRGPNGEIWKLEDHLYELLKKCVQILSDRPLFFMLNSYSAGLSKGVMSYMLKLVVMEHFGKSIENQIKITADEIGLMVSSDKLEFPCGSTVIFEF